MRLWTFQPISVYKELKIKKELFVDENKIEMFHFEDREDVQSKNAYNFMAKVMKERIGYPPDHVRYPWWAWYKTNGLNKKPDLRKMEFRFREDMYCLELELPDKEVLLSDEEMWHCPLNGSPIIMEEGEVAWEEQYDWYQGLNDEVKKKEIEKTWHHCFDISNNTKLYTSHQWIQATFWSLKLENVKEIRFVKAKSSK